MAALLFIRRDFFLNLARRDPPDMNRVADYLGGRFSLRVP